MGWTEVLKSVMQHQSLLLLLTPPRRHRSWPAGRAGCSQNKGLGEVSVRCEAVGCDGVSLVSGKCKRPKWPAGAGVILFDSGVLT